MVDTASKTGFISQIIGPVVDVEFPNGELPKIYNALIISSDGDSAITCEVQQLLGNNKVRAVSMTSTDGLKTWSRGIRYWCTNFCTRRNRNFRSYLQRFR